MIRCGDVVVRPPCPFPMQVKSDIAPTSNTVLCQIIHNRKICLLTVPVFELEKLTAN